MKTFRPSLLRVGAALSTLAAAALFAAPVYAQGPDGVELYPGSDPASITVGDWGSGKATLDKDVSYTGLQSIAIQTQGYYQGASLALKTPVDFGPYLTNPSAYLVLIIRIPGSESGGGQGFGGFPGAGGGGSSSSFPGAGGSGGFPGGSGGFGGRGGQAGLGGPGGGKGGRGGYGGPGGPGGQGGRGGASPTSLANIRIDLTTTGGKSIEALLPLSYAIPKEQWEALSIPVEALAAHGLAASDAQITGIRLFGDTSGYFFLGKISINTDSSPVSFDGTPDQTIGIKQLGTYTIGASAGIRPLKFYWDWDASDGIQQESEGRSAQHAYYEKGDYTVTIMAVDPYTNKKLGKTTFSVHVHE